MRLFLITFVLLSKVYGIAHNDISLIYEGANLDAYNIEKIDFQQEQVTDSSLAACMKRVKAAIKSKDHNSYLFELENILYIEQVDVRKRINIVNNELDNLPEFINPNSIALTKTYKLLASTYMFIEENKDAIMKCDQALRILRNNGMESSKECAEFMALKCKYQQRYGLLHDAIILGEAAKHILDSLNIKSTTYTELLDNLAWTYGLVDNFEKSIQLQQIAVNIYEVREDWLSMVEAYNSILNSATL